VIAPVTRHGHWTCPFAHRVAWALAERDIDHDHVDVAPSVRPQDFVLPASAALVAALGTLATWLDDDPWLAGPQPSSADAVLVPFLVREEALRALGLEPILDLRTLRRVERVDHLEVWGPQIDG
jgi:glutathione S-transferase